MGKFLTLAGILGAVVVVYLIMIPMWPVVYNAAFTTANTINATAHAYEYRATTAGLRFAPLGLFIVPAAIGLVAGYIVLKRPEQATQ